MALLNRITYRAGVWGNAPVEEWLFDPNLVFGVEEDWSSYDSTNTYTATQATTGTAAIDTTAPGRLKMDAGASTAAQGEQIQRLKSVFLPASGKSIWAEFIITLTAASPPVTKSQIFVGLCESDTTIFAAGTLSTSNHIGWAVQTGELMALTFRSNKATVEATKTGTTLVDATQVRLGFRYDGVADTVQQYVNGVTTGAAIATASVPKVVLYPSFVCQSDGTDRPNLFLSAYRVMQLR